MTLCRQIGNLVNQESNNNFKDNPVDFKRGAISAI